LKRRKKKTKKTKKKSPLPPMKTKRMILFALYPAKKK